jgi:putative phage-type endonuclease
MQKTKWINYGSYILSDAQQGSTMWKDLRKGRLTASKFFVTTGKSIHDTPQSLAFRLKTGIDEQFDQKSIECMNHGTVYEPFARQWYEKTRDVKVEEVGLAVPLWDERIGASLDGQVVGTNGIIEIKCPQTMYDHILYQESQQIRNRIGVTIDNVWESHYAQMQGCMVICKKDWCDYIVYSVNDQKVYVQRVNVNYDYWNRYLYPWICHFFNYFSFPL